MIAAYLERSKSTPLDVWTTGFSRSFNVEGSLSNYLWRTRSLRSAQSYAKLGPRPNCSKALYFREIVLSSP